MSRLELSLESQLYLKVLEQQIASLSTENLRTLFMLQATQKALQEHAYKHLLQEALASERSCHLQLSKVEKEHQTCKQVITQQEA